MEHMAQAIFFVEKYLRCVRKADNVCHLKQMI